MIHVRFKGGKTETLTVLNPKSSGQQVKTQTKVVELVDKLLDEHIYSEISDLLNEQGLRPDPGEEMIVLLLHGSPISSIVMGYALAMIDCETAGC